jgi:hypothetical protein
MAKPIQRGSEMQELKREMPFTFTRNEETSMSIKDPDTMFTMIVLLLACLGLAVLAHVVV